MAEGLEALIKKYSEQLAQDPKSRAFVPLSDAYRQLGRYDEAVLVAKEGIKHHPTYVSGKMALARAHFENGDLNEAKELLDSILTFSPDNLLANRLAAEISAQMGDSQGAVESLKRVLAAEPNDGRSRKVLESIEKRSADAKPAGPLTSPTLAELYISQGHLAEGLKAYRALAEADPSNSLYASKIREISETLSPKKEASPVSPHGMAEFLKRLLSRIEERRRPS